MGQSSETTRQLPLKDWLEQLLIELRGFLEDRLLSRA